MRATGRGEIGQRNGQALSRDFWGEALAEHRPWLLHVIRLRLGEEQAVEEVWQEVACQVYHSSRQLLPPANVAAWLYRISVRQVLQHRRKAGRQRRLLTRYADQVAASPPLDPLTWLISRERQEMVRQAMERLSVRDAQVLLLKYTQDWSYQQIGTHLGLSVSAVEARLHRARQRLRDTLRTRGGLLLVLADILHALGNTIQCCDNFRVGSFCLRPAEPATRRMTADAWCFGQDPTGDWAGSKPTPRAVRHRPGHFPLR
jgi:RNA polymerase sigma-70 factor (ECF subfamily)